MRTSAAHVCSLRISDFVPRKCGSIFLSKIRLGDSSSSCLKGKCCRIPPLKSSSFSLDNRGNWSTAGKSSARGRRLQLRSLEGQTTFATFSGEPTTPCDSCNGRGWLPCDFCKGQKVNVQAKNNRIYRRCPSCRTAGVVICPRCKVFRCVSYPDETDTGIAL
ncbi:unnamed protein product [Calypogeia fissa]